MGTLDEFEADGLQVRRAAAAGFTLDEDGQFAGRAVPYSTDVELMPGLVERFEPGAFAAQVKDPGRVKIAYRHGDIIGRVDTLEERGDGLHVRGRIIASEDRPQARLALADLRDGLIDELSVGFAQVRNGTQVTATEQGTHVVHRKAALREISIVPWGAYGRKATVSRVRDEDGPAAEAADDSDMRVRELADSIAALRLPWAARVGPAAQ